MKHRLLLAAAVVLPLALAGQSAVADEGGVSFWLPGQMGSFSAVPGEPGWTVPVIYYHTEPDAEASKQYTLGGRITAGLRARADLVFAVPTYTFPEQVAGGRLAIGMGLAVGSMRGSIDATLTGPGGGTISGGQSEEDSGNSDLYPIATLKWNQGVNNYLLYTMAGVPVGSYEAGRLANLGTNHWSWDVGGGYTYLDKSGYEFSAVAGLTYNFENDDTDYQNGVDIHLDLAASKMVTPQWQLGLVGYYYDQLTGDSGSGAVLGDFKSRVSGIGPQVGYFFPVGGKKWYANVKAIWEFDGRNRPEGWNAWLTLAMSF